MDPDNGAGDITLVQRLNFDDVDDVNISPISNCDGIKAVVQSNDFPDGERNAKSTQLRNSLGMLMKLLHGL